MKKNSSILVAGLLGTISICGTVVLASFFASRKHSASASVRVDTLWATAVVEGIRPLPDMDNNPRRVELIVKSLGIDDNYACGHCRGYFKISLPATDPLVASARMNSAVQVGNSSDCRVRAIRPRQAPSQTALDSVLHWTKPERSSSLVRSSR